MITDTHNHEKIVEQWMLTIVSDSGIRRFDDLHIDRIDPAWKSRQWWIEGGLQAFRLALALRDRNHLPFTVGLGFSLESGSQPIGIDFRTPEEFCETLDWSPPSLYLFHRGEEPDKQVSSAEGIMRALSPAIIGAEGSARCYYLEFRGGGADEYSRSVFVEG
jgi:hypothetical protein